jgi:hypothetical protein
MTKEMTTRGRVHIRGARQNYRYRRFQALNDSLDIFFVLFDAKGKWFTVEDVCKELEFDAEDPAIQKRLRRIAHALARIHRIECTHASRLGQNGSRMRVFMRCP